MRLLWRREKRKIDPYCVHCEDGRWYPKQWCKWCSGTGVETRFQCRLCYGAGWVYIGEKLTFKLCTWCDGFRIDKELLANARY